jgi:methionyl-tRNA formyltransferase
MTSLTTPPSARRPTPSPEPGVAPPASAPSGPARLVFLGSGAFAVTILEALAGAPEVVLVAVVSAPDRPAGRHGELTPTPVARRAGQLGIALLQPSRIRDPEAIAAIAALHPDVGVLADYGRIVPQAVLDIPPNGILNVHPSLLPRHRGASPIPAAILAGDRETGVTLIRMDAGLDSGPVVAVEAWPLAGMESAPEIEARAAAAGAALVLRSLPGWLAGKLIARPQGEAGATLTRPLRRDDGRLDGARSARELERAVRAYRPWPGSFLETPVGRLAVLAAAVEESERGDAPGGIAADGRGLVLMTAEGRLRLVEVQPAGGRPMSSVEFLRGRGRALAGGPTGD